MLPHHNFKHRLTVLNKPKTWLVAITPEPLYTGRERMV
jgi:hypothetical protein